MKKIEDITPEEFLPYWVEALRSGEYGQATNYLGKNKGNKYCCLGVACVILNKIAGQEPNWNKRRKDYYLESGGELSVLGGKEELLFNSPTGQIKDGIESLAEMNDLGATFDEIADFIEANPEQIFKNWKGTKQLSFTHKEMV